MSRIKITVKAFSDCRKYLPADAPATGWETEIDEGAVVRGLLDQLGVPERVALVITVNDSNRKMDAVLNDGDVLKMFPVAMGG